MYSGDGDWTDQWDHGSDFAEIYLLDGVYAHGTIGYQLADAGRPGDGADYKDRAFGRPSWSETTSQSDFRRLVGRIGALTSTRREVAFRLRGDEQLDVATIQQIASLIADELENTGFSRPDVSVKVERILRIKLS